MFLVQSEVANASEHHETTEHPQAARNQGAPPSEFLHNIRPWNGHGKIDATENHRSLERIIQTGCRENSCAIVEEEVGAGQLLKRLHANAEQSAVHHAWAGEDFIPRVFSTTSVLGIELGLDFTDLAINFPVVLRHAVRLCNGGSRARDFALAVLPSRRLAEEHDADRHDDRPDVSDTHGNSPGRGVVVCFGPVVDAVGDEDTKSDEELVT